MEEAQGPPLSNYFVPGRGQEQQGPQQQVSATPSTASLSGVAEEPYAIVSCTHRDTYLRIQRHTFIPPIDRNTIRHAFLNLGSPKMFIITRRMNNL